MAGRQENIDLVRNFYKNVINAHDISELDKFMRDDFMQHDAVIEDGKTGFIKFTESYFAKKPQVEIVKVFANDNDEVAVFCKCVFKETGVIDKVTDIFRLEDGLLAEHWDVIEPDIGDKEIINGREMFATYAKSTPSPETSEQESNIKTVCDFNRDIFDAHDTSRLDQFMQDDYMQHNAGVKSGKEGFIKFTDFFFTLKPEMKIYKTFGNEDGEVCVFFKCICHGNGWENKVADIYRLRDGKLAEHWDVVEHDIGNVKTVNGRELF